MGQRETERDASAILESSHYSLEDTRMSLLKQSWHLGALLFALSLTFTAGAVADSEHHHDDDETESLGDRRNAERRVKWRSDDIHSNADPQSWYVSKFSASTIFTVSSARAAASLIVRWEVHRYWLRICVPKWRKRKTLRSSCTRAITWVRRHLTLLCYRTNRQFNF